MRRAVVNAFFHQNTITVNLMISFTIIGCFILTKNTAFFQRVAFDMALFCSLAGPIATTRSANAVLKLFLHRGAIEIEWAFFFNSFANVGSFLTTILFSKLENMNFLGSLKYSEGSTASIPRIVYSYTAGPGRNLSGKTSRQLVENGSQQFGLVHFTT